MLGNSFETRNHLIAITGDKSLNTLLAYQKSLQKIKITLIKQSICIFKAAINSNIATLFYMIYRALKLQYCPTLAFILLYY